MENRNNMVDQNKTSKKEKYLIGKQYVLLYFIELQHSYLPNKMKIKIQLFYNPKGFVLQLNGNVTNFSIEYSIRDNPKGVLNSIMYA